MRFDFIPFFNPGDNLPWDQIIAMYREQTQIAEQGGFTTVWVTEHHFAHDGYLNATPNPILMCADLAAHFKNIRVGQAPVVLTDWHPLRVAEDIAMLDNMTNGRVDFGVAKGVNERQTIQFNINADRRDNEKCFALYRESLDIILKAWTEDPFTYKGEFYQFPVPGWHETNKALMPHDPRYIAEDGEYIAMHVHPRPYQQPHPPVWLLSNAPSTYDFAGLQGYNVIGMASPPGRTRECWSAYSNALAKRESREVALGEGVAACTQIYVADTMEEAIETVRPATNIIYEFMNGARPAGEWQRKVYLDEGHELTSADRDSDWFDFLHGKGIVWAGTADYVAEKIHEAQLVNGLDHLILLQNFAGVPYEKIRASMAKFAERVVPRFGTLPRMTTK